MKKLNHFPGKLKLFNIVLGFLVFFWVAVSCTVSSPVNSNVPELNQNKKLAPIINYSAAIIDTNVTIDASTVIRTIPEEIFGQNIAAWNGTTDGKHQFLDNYVKIMGVKNVRYPGGSWADILAWDTVGTVSSNSWQLDNEEAINFAKVNGANLQAIVNFSGYWDGVQHTHTESVQKAVDWVRHMNITRGFPIKYWEIGNENFGSWEQGYTNGTAYGNRFADFYKAMKAVDPTIQIGAVSVPYDNGEGWTGYTWWMRDMLTALKAQNVIPDFLVIHTYPTDSPMSPENDANLLQAPSTIAGLTANLDQMVAQYLGSSYVGKIKYNMTEYRSCLNGRTQLISFIDAMFTAQYLMEMAKHGWAGANLWDMRNGWDNANNGDMGMFHATEDVPYPTYYVFPLLTSKFGRAMVSTTVSDNSLIKAYASKDASGNLTILLINNSPDTDLPVHINITGFNAGSTAQSWTLEAAGTTLAGGTSPVQERTNIMYNGVVQPSASETYYMPGITTPSGQQFTYTVKKSTIVLLRVPDKNSTSSSSSAVSSMAFASSSSRPSNYEFVIPGKVDAASYTNMNGVQVEECSDTDGGTDIGWIDYGDWCDYNVTVQTAGTYTLSYRIAGVGSTGGIQLLMNGQNLKETPVISTGGWQIWTTVSTTVSLQAGKQVMRLFFNGTGFNIHWAKLMLTGSSSSEQTSSTVSFSSSVLSSSRSSVVVSSSSSSSTSSLTYTTVPAKIEAENYIAMSGIQTEPCSEGTLNVGWVDTGDWMDYAINVPINVLPVAYAIELRLASIASSGSIDVLLDGVKIASSAVPNTGGWQTWTTLSLPVNLTAGIHKLRIYASSSPWNFNYLNIKASPITSSSSSTASSSSSPSVNLPGKIIAAQYDAMSGVQTEPSSEGGLNVGWIDAGDWMEYTVNVSSADSYNVEYRVASLYGGGSITIQADGNTLTTTSLPKTGGWQTYASVNTLVNLSAGRQKLRVLAAAGGWNITTINITRFGVVSSSSSTVTSSSSSRPVSSSSSSSSSAVSSSSSSTSSSSSSSGVVYTVITAPFSNDGAGEYYWQMSNIPSYINCWNLDVLDINGVSFLNKYASTSALPPKQNGYYYIHYKSSVSWGHFEAK